MNVPECLTQLYHIRLRYYCKSQTTNYFPLKFHIAYHTEKHIHEVRWLGNGLEPNIIIFHTQKTNISGEVDPDNFEQRAQILTYPHFALFQ